MWSHKILFLSIFISICNLSIFAQKVHPMTQAMLDAYEQILKENPSDYFTLFQRAQQFYNLNLYDKALIDIDKAIELTPSKEIEILSNLYSLKANTYIELNDYDKSLESIDFALQNKPDSYPLLYTKGNICLHLNDLESAKKSFRRMQQIKSRSQEAFFGLARVAILENDIALAKTLMTEAENCDPSNYITFCRLGDLYVEMLDYDKAATNYLSAFGLSSNQQRPLNSLMSLARINYESVKNAIDFAISKSPNIISLYILEANIAYYNNHFHDAYECYRHILDFQENNEATIIYKMADTCLALNKIDDALIYANRAVALYPSIENFILKSKIERAANNPQNALIAATEAINNSERNSTDALVEASLSLIMINKIEEAIKLLNEAIMVNAEEIYPLMIRSYVYDAILGDLRNSVSDYQRASELNANDFPQLLFKAFALTMSGNKIKGDEIIITEAQKNSSNPQICYYIAVYYAQTGELEKAIEYRDKAIELGFENEYLLYVDKTANLNLTPISHL